MRPLLRPAAWFTVIGLLLYGLLFAASEELMRNRGHSHPLYKISRLQQPTYDWVVLGASHAMPLDFAGMNAELQRASGYRIAQLAGTGTGPLYNRFILDKFLQQHTAGQLLYAVDAFAFYARTWNEDRFADVRLTRRMPWEPGTLALLARYVRHEGVDFRAWLDYASGFSKINNRERFEIDRWDGERQFERRASTSTSTTVLNRRVAYLYPEGTLDTVRQRYFMALAELVATARSRGMAVTLVKLPLPTVFRRRLPDEAAFDAALRAQAALMGARFVDFSDALPDPQAYFDTDHLNRDGLRAFMRQSLVPLLAGRAAE